MPGKADTSYCLLLNSHTFPALLLLWYIRSADSRTYMAYHPSADSDTLQTDARGLQKNGRHLIAHDSNQHKQNAKNKSAASYPDPSSFSHKISASDSLFRYFQKHLIHDRTPVFLGLGTCVSIAHLLSGTVYEDRSRHNLNLRQ